MCEREWSELTYRRSIESVLCSMVPRDVLDDRGDCSAETRNKLVLAHSHPHFPSPTRGNSRTPSRLGCLEAYSKEKTRLDSGIGSPTFRRAGGTE